MDIIVSITKKHSVASTVSRPVDVKYKEEILLTIPEEKLWELQMTYRRIKNSMQVWIQLRNWIYETTNIKDFVVIKAPKVVKDIINYQFSTEPDSISSDAFMY